MEVPSITLRPLDTAKYDTQSAAEEQSPHPAVAPSALLAELQDRSFDLGDDEEDLEPVASTSKRTLESPGHDIQDDEDVEDLLDEATSQNNDGAELDLGLPPGVDPFSDEVADAMLDELKETGMFKFIQRYVVDQEIPLTKLLLVFGIVTPRLEEGDPDNSVYLLRLLKVAISRALRNRIPLGNVTTPADLISLLRTSRKIVVLTGAGISTNCGIPDFRSPQGIYARLVASGKYPELTDPQEMFDMSIFLENPEIFYSFAKELYPSSDVIAGSPGTTGSLGGGKAAGKVHHWIRRLEKEDRLLRNYTQNIDTLEMVAGIEKVLHAHGSFASCSCVICKTQFPGEHIKEAIFSETVPLCPVCTAIAAVDAPSNGPPAGKKRKLANGASAGSRGYGGNGRDDDEEDEEENYVSPWKDKPILKPDITFFGQALDDSFDRCLLADREEVDLLIVVGTSLQVAPVSELLSHIPHRIPQILINRDPVPHVMQHVDLALLGDCDGIIDWIGAQMQAQTPSPDPGPSTGEGTASSSTKLGAQGLAALPRLALPEGMDNVWLFEGANEEHRWMARMRELIAEEQEAETDSQPGASVPT